MKSTYRTTLCSLLLFALRVVGVGARHEDDLSLIGEEGDPKETTPGPCATVRCGNPCFLQPFPCSENQVCIPGANIGCCPEAKCCADPCKKSKYTKATKCQKDQVCQANASKAKNFCPTAECVDRCSTTTCYIGDFCGQLNVECDNGLVCSNTFQSPTDCCPSGYECV